jgi:hypothetical protein
MVRSDLARVVVACVVVVVPSVGRSRSICGSRSVVVTTRARNRRGIHTPFNHGRRAGSEGAVAAVVGNHMRLVVEHPRLTSKDIRIEGVVSFPLKTTLDKR